jgi:hypothetical protein
MVVRNKDGTPYAVSGSLSQLMPDSPTNELFNQYDQETIRLGGSPILYYEVFISGVDKQYMESRNKIWSQTAVELFGMYDPIASQMAQGLFGIDGPDTLIITVNYADAISKLGHLPVVGSRIYTPMLREHWEVIDRKLDNFTRWQVYHILIHCQRFQDTLTNPAGTVSQGDQPTWKID